MFCKTPHAKFISSISHWMVMMISKTKWSLIHCLTGRRISAAVHDQSRTWQCCPLWLDGLAGSGIPNFFSTFKDWKKLTWIKALLKKDLWQYNTSGTTIVKDKTTSLEELNSLPPTQLLTKTYIVKYFRQSTIYCHREHKLNLVHQRRRIPRKSVQHSPPQQFPWYSWCTFTQHIIYQYRFCGSHSA